MSDSVLNNVFSTPVLWDFHLNFFSKMIKLNLQQRNWTKMRKKCSKAFANFWAFFWYFYFPPWKKNSLTIFWYLCHTLITDLLGELTLLWYNFFGRWLTHPYLGLLGAMMKRVLVYSQSEKRTAWITANNALNMLFC